MGHSNNRLPLGRGGVVYETFARGPNIRPRSRAHKLLRLSAYQACAFLLWSGLQLTCDHMRKTVTSHRSLLCTKYGWVFRHLFCVHCDERSKLGTLRRVAWGLRKISSYTIQPIAWLGSTFPKFRSATSRILRRDCMILFGFKLRRGD